MNDGLTAQQAGAEFRPKMALGLVGFGTSIAEETAFCLLDAYAGAGGGWIDTANCYSYWADPSGRGGASEAVVGKWLRAHPDGRALLKIATKVGCEPVPRSVNPAGTEGLSRRVIKDGIQESLERLSTDRVDLYWAHRDDLDVAQEETVGAFADLVEQGVIGRWGYSNAALWRVERARGIALAHGWPTPTALQLRYTYLQPRPFVRDHTHDHRFGWVTDETLDYVEKNADVEVWAYSPLMRGAYDRPDRPISEAFDHSGSTRRLEVLRKNAALLGLSRSELVAAWMSGGTPPITPILGVSTLAQLESALKASAYVVPPEVMAELDEPW